MNPSPHPRSPRASLPPTWPQCASADASGPPTTPAPPSVRMLGANIRHISRAAAAGHNALALAPAARSLHTLRTPAVSRASRPVSRVAFPRTQASAPTPLHVHAHAHAHAPASLSAIPASERGMKVKTSLQKRCSSCQIVRRRGKWFVICKAHPRHKQVCLSPCHHPSAQLRGAPFFLKKN